MRSDRHRNNTRLQRILAVCLRGPLSRWILAAVAISLLSGGYWLLPIRGQVLVITDPTQQYLGSWPQVWADPPAARPGERVMFYIRDYAPWPHLKLLVNGVEVQRDEAYPAGSGPWTWRWRFPAPEAVSYQVVLYHSCHQGCIERTRLILGTYRSTLPTRPPPARPTKLGVVFPDPQRDWHGRSGWAVELTYSQRPNDPDWGIDGLARRVAQAQRQGLRVLVRIAYDQRQSLPPVGDQLALARYLEYSARLARDDRLRGVYGYFIGSGFNTAGENQLAPDRPTTPEWYARIFNGYRTDPAHTDNVVQTFHGIDPRIRVLIGPVTPWSKDYNGVIPDPHDVPWLNYMNTLVAYIDTTAQVKQERGIALATPDGFAIHAPGRPGAPEVAANPAAEPTADLHRAEWRAAQAGFRVYRDWLAIINRYPTTRGLPAYITSTNTFPPDEGTPPAQNYPAGWLTNAFQQISREPQVSALCWFVDAPFGEMWSAFSLSAHPGRLADAADEFDRLLRQ